MTIAITGADGQLGTELCQLLGARAHGLTLPDFDLRDRDCIERTLFSLQPDAIINTAAYTAVDRAEEDRETCRQINANAVAVISDVCDELDIPLVQISTDYVFNGNVDRNRPYVEEDTTDPQSCYANTKLLGEHYAAMCRKHFIIRSSGLYSVIPESPVKGRNFVETMLCLGQQLSELKVVSDQRCTPTFITHLAEAIDFLLGTTEYGMYHVTNSGETNWCEFASTIFEMSGIDVDVVPITTEEFGAAAARPAYSVLDCSKYQRVRGKALPRWEDAIYEYLQRVEKPLAKFA